MKHPKPHEELNGDVSALGRANLWPVGEIFKKDVAGQLTGEFRMPRRGEWYLSGDNAWRAINDYKHSPYYILRLVEVSRVEVITVIGSYPPKG